MRLHKPLVLAIGMVLCQAAAAQDSVTQFRFTAAPDNIQGCIALDPSFTRVHTLTVRGGVVEIKSAGGIDDTMKPVRAGLYAATFQLAGGQIDFVLDANANPKTLTATSKNLGCKWTAVPMS